MSQPSASREGPANDPILPTFALAWMLAYAFHYLDLGVTHPHFLTLGALSLPVILAPQSALPFGVFVVVAAVFGLIDLPAPANHIVLALLVNLALIGVAAYLLMFGSRAPRSSDIGFGRRWLDAVRVPATLTLLVVYAFAAFDKLNSSFFDPHASCAAALASQGESLLSLPAVLPDWAVRTVAVGTLIVETALPILLAVRRWRPYGALVGLIFHLGLGVSGFEDFATFAYGIYILMMADVVAKVPNGDRWRRRALVTFAIYMAVVATDAALRHLHLGQVPRLDTITDVIWVIGVLLLMGPIVATAWRDRAVGVGVSLGRATTTWALLLPVVACLNGLAPYLGLKTVSTFSMFSNLRTEDGRPNFLLKPLSALEMTSWMRDNADVSVFDAPEAQHLTLAARASGGMTWLGYGSRWTPDGAPARVPWIELRRTVVRYRDAGVTGLSIRYTRAGVERTVADATTDPELAAPLPWWVRWFIAFRDIDVTETEKCHW